MSKPYLAIVAVLMTVACTNHTANITLDAPHRPVDSAVAADGASDGAIVGVGRYGSDGPLTGTPVTASVSGGASSTFNVTIYIPSGAGPYPTIMLSSGLEQPALAYVPYATRLSSWGIVTILRDDPGVLANTADIVTDVSYIITTWLPAQNTDSSSPLFGKVDATKLGLAGHSRGGYVSLMSAEQGALGKIKGVFGLDPVDTSPSAGTALATIGVPLAFIGETTDSTGNNACAPAGSNYQALYGDAASPITAITANNADHTMFEDSSNCEFCSLCTAGSADQATVLAYSVRYLTAFFARVLQGDTSVGVTFNGAGAQSDIASGAITLESK